MHDYEGFDLEAILANAWETFTERLSDVLAVMDDSADLTIGLLSAHDGGSSPFIRFTCDPHRMLTVEAASNPALSEHDQLSPAGLQLMSELGWKDPNVAEGHPSDCFWAQYDQENSSEAAELSVRTLRDVYGVQHPAFLAPDQLADILTLQPESISPVTPYDADDVMAYIPAHRQHLDTMIESELVDLYGHEPFRDSEGDYAIRFGSTMVFIRSMPDAREVQVFSTVVHDIEGRSRAVEVINDLNAEARYVRFQLVRDRVFVSMSVLAHPFVPAHLHQAIRAVSQVSDGVDDDLAAKLHGRTTFPNENPR